MQVLGSLSLFLVFALKTRVHIEREKLSNQKSAFIIEPFLSWFCHFFVKYENIESLTDYQFQNGKLYIWFIFLQKKYISESKKK